MRNRLPDRAEQRLVGYGFLAALLSVVSDGWSGKPSPLLHQIFLIPCALAFGAAMLRLLQQEQGGQCAKPGNRGLPEWWLALIVLFESGSIVMVSVEARHFKSFGYRLTLGSCLTAVFVSFIAWISFYLTRRSCLLFLAVLTTYGSGMIVAIRCFPLNYFRSDMLPVISWADERLLHHLNPYQTMHVGTRLYDFPYLPGMLLAFWPAQALHADLRFATCFYLFAAALLIYVSSRQGRRRQVAALLGLFLLCPFLQYRHDLYLEPHWFTLVLAVVLMNRRHFGWSAVVWGISCGVYQLSWVILPFFLLNGLRRRGIAEFCKLGALNVLGAMLVVGPFLRSATHSIARNTVGQWSHLPHALADPINVSFWLTYFIRPDHLRWVQAIVLTALLAYCFLARRCTTVVDTVRWMTCALAFFIPLNVLVDGYFYLTLLLLALLYVCVANEWWGEPAARLAERQV